MSKIAITDYFSKPSSNEVEILGDLIGTDITEETEVLMVWHKDINEKTVGGIPKLRAVQRYGVGFDNLDLEYLKSRNITCCNNPAYGVDEVSDTAMAYIQAINRGIFTYDAKARKLSSGWQEHINNNIKRVNQTKIGVIGAGRIGTSVILKCRALGYQVLFYDPHKESGFEKVVGANRCHDIKSLLNTSDIVSLHCPLNSETKSLINKEFIEEMKFGSSLVNTARGKLLKNTDLIYQALKTGKLSHVYVDVLPQEPPKKDLLFQAWQAQPEWIQGRLLINPHTSYFSQSSIIDLRRDAALNALRLFQNESPLNVI